MSASAVSGRSRRIASKIRIRRSGHPELVLDLRNHSRRVGCIAVEVAPDVLKAAIPNAPPVAQGRFELRLYLGAWAAARGVDADLEG
jgi:hypothetical protein